MKQKDILRVPIEHMASTLHSCIASFTFTHPNIKGEGKGTAFLISKDIMVTSAHNFYNKNTRNYNQGYSVKFSGSNGLLWSTYSIKNVFLPDEFIDEDNPNKAATHDYAFFKLDRDVQTDSFLTLGTSFNREKTTLFIYGYPASKYFLNSENELDCYQYGLKQLNEMIGSQQDKAQIRCRYDISTEPGQSGCPIVVKTKNQDIVVAVHKGEKQGKFNYGRIITMDFLINLQIWRRQYGGHPFQCIDCQTHQMINFNQEKYKEIIDMICKERKIRSQMRESLEQMTKEAQFYKKINQSRKTSERQKSNYIQHNLQNQDQKIDQILINKKQGYILSSNANSFQDNKFDIPNIASINLSWKRALYAQLERLQPISGWEFLETTVDVEDQRNIKIWETDVSNSIKGFQSKEILMLPIRREYHPKERSGNTGSAKIYYFNVPYLLSQEIKNRKTINKEFNEDEIWYILFHLVRAAKDFQSINRKIGDVRPHNIFISESGLIKIGNVFSWPYEKTNFQKTAYEKQLTYVSPQEMQLLKKGKINSTTNFVLSESFSIGLTLLEMGILFKADDLYSLQDMEIKINKLKGLLKEWSNCKIYSNVLKFVVAALCEPDASKRISSIEIEALLRPYKEEILDMEDFDKQVLSNLIFRRKNHRFTYEQQSLNKNYLEGNPLGKEGNKALIKALWDELSSHMLNDYKLQFADLLGLVMLLSNWHIWI